MSGIAGIVNLDGAPVDRGLLEPMTRLMAFRGHDHQQVWMDGCAGFGHDMLRTTEEAACERQPCTLEGEIWITADARIDDRAGLVAELASRGLP